MIIVAQPRHAFACARGRGKTGVTVTVTGLSLRYFSSSSIFNKTLREEPSLHRSDFPIHVHGPVFMALCRLSRVPWSEVEGKLLLDVGYCERRDRGGVSIDSDTGEDKFVMLNLHLWSTLGPQVCKYMFVPVKNG